jgi:hypothetical protein
LRDRKIVSGNARMCWSLTCAKKGAHDFAQHHAETASGQHTAAADLS